MGSKRSTIREHEADFGSADGHVYALDAATGDLIYECGESVGTEEILINDGVLFLLRNPERESADHKEPIRSRIDGFNSASPYGEHKKEIMAVDAVTGKVLWHKTSVVLATTLAADSRKVYFHNGAKIVCLDRKDGTELWMSPLVARISPVPANFTPTLVVYRDVVLFAGGIGDNETMPDLLTAIDGNDGY